MFVIAVKGDSIFVKPQKLYLANTNLHHAYCNSVEVGILREVFFISMLKEENIEVANRGDFIVNDKYVVEIGGKNIGLKFTYTITAFLAYIAIGFALYLNRAIMKVKQ